MNMQSTSTMDFFITITDIDDCIDPRSSNQQDTAALLLPPLPPPRIVRYTNLTEDEPFHPPQEQAALKEEDLQEDRDDNDDTNEDDRSFLRRVLLESHRQDKQNDAHNEDHNDDDDATFDDQKYYHDDLLDHYNLRYDNYADDLYGLPPLDYHHAASDSTASDSTTSGVDITEIELVPSDASVLSDVTMSPDDFDLDLLDIIPYPVPEPIHDPFFQHDFDTESLESREGLDDNESIDSNAQAILELEGWGGMKIWDIRSGHVERYIPMTE